MHIGKRIKEKRIEKGWTQRELAARMGYTNHSTLARIETGHVEVTQSRIVQFAEVLDTSIAYLMGYEDTDKEKSAETDGLSESKIKLLDFVKSVPEDKAELILQVMRTIVESDR